MTITKMVSLSLCRLMIKRAWQMKTLLGGRTWQPWWRVIQMKEPQIYLVDKAGEGSSLFLGGGGCLISNTFTLKSLWKGVHWGKGAIFISGCIGNFKVHTLGGCSFFYLVFWSSTRPNSTSKHAGLVPGGWWWEALLAGLNTMQDSGTGPASPGSPSDCTYSTQKCPGWRQ